MREGNIYATGVRRTDGDLLGSRTQPWKTGCQRVPDAGGVVFVPALVGRRPTLGRQRRGRPTADTRFGCGAACPGHISGRLPYS